MEPAEYMYSVKFSLKFVMLSLIEFKSEPKNSPKLKFLKKIYTIIVENMFFQKIIHFILTRDF